jgi:hypothetical protein
MLHNESLKGADSSYEIRSNNFKAIHVHIKDGEAICFPTLHDFVLYCYFGDSNVERFYLKESLLDDLYQNENYDYHSLKEASGNL